MELLLLGIWSVSARPPLAVMIRLPKQHHRLMLGTVHGMALHPRLYSQYSTAMSRSTLPVYTFSFSSSFPLS